MYVIEHPHRLHGLRRLARALVAPVIVSSVACALQEETAETLVWLDFARDCAYITPAIQQHLTAQYEEIGRMLGSMIAHPEKFIPR